LSAAFVVDDAKMFTLLQLFIAGAGAGGGGVRW
jgi:hypothetical protein